MKVNRRNFIGRMLGALAAAAIPVRIKAGSASTTETFRPVERLTVTVVTDNPLLWQWAKSLRGKVNSKEFLGHRPGELIYLGYTTCVCHRDGRRWLQFSHVFQSTAVRGHERADMSKLLHRQTSFLTVKVDLGVEAVPVKEIQWA